MQCNLPCRSIKKSAKNVLQSPISVTIEGAVLLRDSLSLLQNSKGKIFSFFLVFGFAMDGSYSDNEKVV